MDIDLSLTKLTSTLNGEGGPVFKNRFSVNINFPLIVGAGTFGGERIDLMCESAFMPGHRVTTGEHTTIANPIKIPYSFTTEEINFTFHLNNNYLIKTYFDRWLELIINSETYELAYKKDIVANSWEVYQLNKENNYINGTKLYNVMPVGISPIDFSNTASDIQIATISVIYDRKENIPYY